MNLNQPHYIEERENSIHISLEGTWKYGYTEESTETPEKLDYPYTAVLPDSLYWNLYHSGITGHPYEGMNSKQFHWVDEKIWYYRKEFEVDSELTGRSAILCFDGASYYSRIWLNGVLFGEHEGMFGGPYIEVGKTLKYGEKNELIVEIRACNYGKKENYDGWNERGTNREIVPWNTVRDSRTSNGDWMVIGLWRSVRLEFLAPTHIARPYLVTTALGEEKAKLRLEMEIIGPELNELHSMYSFLDDDVDLGVSYTFAYAAGIRQAMKEIPASVLIRFVEKESRETALETEYPVQLLDYTKSLRAKDYPESQFFEQEFDMENPKLWWPHDMGEPFLYEVEISLKVDGCICDRLCFDFGIRTIELERTTGPRVRSRWGKYQFVINGKKVFLKGVNWMPQDALYHEDAQEYRWSLGLVRNAGIHLVRIWSGGGMPESNAFYQTCDEFGIMVWQDHFIANTSHTEGWPQDILETQESVNLFRIRNHPSLAVHCGGNEFNAYSAGNAAAMFVISRTVKMLDPYREFYYTTPDQGSAHIYRDMEPTWYRHLYKDLPFVAETGIHSLPSFKAMRTYLNEKECTEKVPDMTSEAFGEKFPEMLNHFTEYVPERVPRMLARASQIIDLSDTDLAGIAEATQMASCEYYQILIQSLRENYPITAGVMPWVFKRTWPTAGIQLVDGTGEPIPPYYYLKNAYSNVEAHLALERVSYAPGETVRVPVRICNEYEANLNEYTVQIRVWSPDMNLLYEKKLCARDANEFVFEVQTQNAWEDQFFFLTIALYQKEELINRQVYWPKCLSVLKDTQVLEKYCTNPQENFYLKHGPWLKTQVNHWKNTEIVTEIKCVKKNACRVETEVLMENKGDMPAFPVHVQFTDIGTRGMASDNWFWMESGEKRILHLEAAAVGRMPEKLRVEIKAWNVPKKILEI